MRVLRRVAIAMSTFIIPISLSTTWLYFAFEYSDVLISFIVFSSFLKIVTILHVLSYKRRNEKATLFWILFIIVLPMYGSFFYVVNGSHYIKYDVKLKRKNKERAELFNLKESRFMLRDSNYESYKIFTNGFDKYNSLIDDLMSAKKEIIIQYFIVRSDYVFNTIYKILEKKEKEGVKIMIATDFVGSWTFDLKKFKELKKTGMETDVYNPVVASMSQGSMNHRNHRKAVIIDSNIVYAGGMNLAKYYGGMSSKFGIWIDLHFRFIGKALASEYKRTFMLDWKYSKKQTEIPNKVKVENESNITVFDDGPDISEPILLNYLVEKIDKTEKKLYIAMPYPIFPVKLEKSIINAKKRGVEVIVIAPGIPDKLSAYCVSYAYMKKLSQNGIITKRIDGIFLHSKLIIADDEVITGTSNTDYRSFYQHYETNFVLKEDKIVNELNDLFKEYISMSYEIKYKFKKIPAIDSAIYYLFKIPSPVL